MTPFGCCECFEKVTLYADGSLACGCGFLEPYEVTHLQSWCCTAEDIFDLRVAPYEENKGLLGTLLFWMKEPAK